MKDVKLVKNNAEPYLEGGLDGRSRVVLKGFDYCAKSVRTLFNDKGINPDLVSLLAPEDTKCEDIEKLLRGEYDISTVSLLESFLDGWLDYVRNDLIIYLVNEFAPKKDEVVNAVKEVQDKKPKEIKAVATDKPKAVVHENKAKNDDKSENLPKEKALKKEQQKEDKKVSEPAKTKENKSELKTSEKEETLDKLLMAASDLQKSEGETKTKKKKKKKKKKSDQGIINDGKVQS